MSYLVWADVETGYHSRVKLLVPLIVVGVIVSVVLFLTGFVSPPRSQRWEQLTSRLFRKGERKSDASAGRLGDASREAFRMTRRTTERSGAKGRQLHKKITGRNDDSLD
jgi:hypothetical protein